jgi:mannan endo-1,4-beta-mannosidase
MRTQFNLKILILILFIFLPGFLLKTQSQTMSDIFIRRQGDKLMEGDRQFRFFGLAAPNIQQNESQIRKDRTNRFPDEYEIRDILSALQSLGSRATRTFSLSIFSPDDNGMPVYISSHQNYNEEAFRCLDRVIALCHEYDIRLIIPFIASQRFGGIHGVDEFSTLSGKAAGSFWTDESVKTDFKHFLNFLLNRKNTVSGIIYKNDPAILAWQLGNEFGSYIADRNLNYAEWSPRILAWSKEMAAYLKKQDTNHLIMEGGGADRNDFLTDNNIDIISEHLYEYWNKMGGKDTNLTALAKEAWLACREKKPLVIDEFGLGNTRNLSDLMTAIVESGISGGLLWSIRSHRRDGGWYYHNEGGTPVNSFHFPGFPVGSTYDETRLLDLLKINAFRIRGIAPNEIKKPAPAPQLFVHGQGFTWRGSAGASFYIIERSFNSDGPWAVLATGLHDSVLAEVVKFESSAEGTEPLTLYFDETASPGVQYFYRIKAINTAGETEYSNILMAVK